MQCEGDRSAIHLVEPELALGLGDAAEPRKIVGETDDPPLVDRAPQDQLFRGERVQREKVERRDPGQREMVAIGHEVARKEERGVAIGDAHGLGPAGVALHAVEPHARKYFDGLIDELELARNLEGRVVVRQIAAAGSLIRGDRILPLATLEHVARAREGGDDPTVIAVGVPAGVVEVQVRVDDQRYLLGSHAEGLELIQQPRRILDPEYLLLPIGQLRAGAGLDDHRVVGVANEQAVHVHGHETACVGGLLPLPEILRHDPEHRAAIEAEDAIAEDPNVETTNAHEASVWVAVEIRDLRRNDADALRRCGVRAVSAIDPAMTTHPWPRWQRGTRGCASSEAKATASSRPRSPVSMAVAAGCTTWPRIPTCGAAASRHVSFGRSRTVCARWTAGSSTSSCGRAMTTRWLSGPALATTVRRPSSLRRSSSSNERDRARPEAVWAHRRGLR